MKLFGLLGKTLKHSFSPQYFLKMCAEKNFVDAEYQLFELENLTKLPELLLKNNLCGFSVTIPYKTAIISYLDEIDEIAQAVGAVNCVVRKNNKWIGYNTDVFGFEETMKQFCNHKFVNERKALILGNGGAAKAVKFVLSKLQIPYQIVSRLKTLESLSYDEVSPEILSNVTFIINCSPIGMFPNNNEKPMVSYDSINQHHILIDLIYNPEETQFLREGRVRNAKTANGMLMLQKQAERAFFIFYPTLNGENQKLS